MAWLPLIAAWVGAIAVFTAWISQTPPHVLREQLKTLQFWSLEMCVLAAFGGWVVILSQLRHEFGRIHGVRLLALMTVGVALTLFVAPRTNRIFYDEQIYQSIGHNLADLRRAQMCLDGTVEYGRLECAGGEYNKQPYAYPHLLSIVYRIGGATAGGAHALNAAAMALTVAAVYLVVLLLFQDSTSALFGGLIIALTPHQILWSATAAVEPSASLACIASVLAFAHFARARTTSALVAAGVAVAYAVQFRPESFLIVPIVAVLLVQLVPEELTRTRLWWVGLLCFALVSVHLAHLFAVRNEGWGTSDARFSLDYVLPNLRVNGGFYVRDERFPVAYTVLALGGLAAARLAQLRLTVLLYFSVFFGIGLLFYAGSYNYGADVRYSLMTYPPVAILAGLGAGQLCDFLRRLRDTLPVRRVVAGLLVFQFLWYAPLVRATTEEAWAARADVEFAARVAKELPPNSYVLTHNPGMFHLWGVNAGQMFLAADNPGRLQYLEGRYAGGVYFHWNFWCNVTEPTQQAMCRKVLSMARSKLVHEYREQGHRLSFHRMTLQPNALPHTASHGGP